MFRREEKRISKVVVKSHAFLRDQIAEFALRYGSFQNSFYQFSIKDGGIFKTLFFYTK